jgi:putative ABC transport system substrate-binding protein
LFSPFSSFDGHGQRCSFRGGNITGLSNMALDLSAKRIELLKDMVGGSSRVPLLVNAGDPEGARR